jgi:hypothetical protein
MKIQFPIQVVTSFLALSMATSAFAADLQLVEAQVTQIFVKMTGTIAQGDDAKLNALFESIKQASPKSVIVLQLNGEGGDLETAMKMGEAIRSRGVYTATISLPKINRQIDVGCVGSCAFVWLGGVDRKAGSGSGAGAGAGIGIGLIAPMFPVGLFANQEDLDRATKDLKAKVAAYAAKMGAPDWFSLFVFETKNATHYLTESELVQFPDLPK